MSTDTSESRKPPIALPSVGPGETLFGFLAIAVGVLALIANLSGMFS